MEELLQFEQDIQQQNRSVEIPELGQSWQSIHNTMRQTLQPKRDVSMKKVCFEADRFNKKQKHHKVVILDSFASIKEQLKKIQNIQRYDNYSSSKDLQKNIKVSEHVLKQIKEVKQDQFQDSSKYFLDTVHNKMQVNRKKMISLSITPIGEKEIRFEESKQNKIKIVNPIGSFVMFRSEQQNNSYLPKIVKVKHNEKSKTEKVGQSNKIISGKDQKNITVQRERAFSNENFTKKKQFSVDVLKKPFQPKTIIISSLNPISLNSSKSGINYFDDLKMNPSNILLTIANRRRQLSIHSLDSKKRNSKIEGLKRGNNQNHSLQSLQNIQMLLKQKQKKQLKLYLKNNSKNIQKQLQFLKEKRKKLTLITQSKEQAQIMKNIR